MRVKVSARRSDRGSATLWAVALMGLLMAVATALAMVGSVRVARHRLNDAADLSALAAAKLAIIDPKSACAHAAAIAEENGVELSNCTITGEVADVWTTVKFSLPGLGTRTLTGRSRAGPARQEHPQPSKSPKRSPFLPARKAPYVYPA
ncbi:Rv3654c family TadE-like protein [Nonomuraea glycinis]|uniref:Rv3654c family TadE-like protein n=1 Tax=Nonomuraea glycinis TaxID=2047744 RepID=UPI002E11883B|nr:flp pilus-assembly TadE/G-like family protein [Nonomuraea glycinis]